MAKVCVYAELSDGKLNSAVPEIMARARELGDVSVVALGTGAKEAAATLGKHGAKVAYVNEDKVFDDYLAEPATDVMHALQQQDAHDLILFPFTTDSRDIAGRLAARLGTSLISNASDITAEGGSFVAKVPYFGGAKVASMKANGKPAIVLIRPKSFEASETGGSADVKDAPGALRAAGGDSKPDRPSPRVLPGVALPARDGRVPGGDPPPRHRRGRQDERVHPPRARPDRRGGGHHRSLRHVAPAEGTAARVARARAGRRPRRHGQARSLLRRSGDASSAGRRADQR